MNNSDVTNVFSISMESTDPSMPLPATQFRVQQSFAGLKPPAKHLFADSPRVVLDGPGDLEIWGRISRTANWRPQHGKRLHRRGWCSL